jgi:hypothetical protein
MRRSVILPLWTMVLALAASDARAQDIPRPDYFTYMPPGLPLPVAEQPASAQFQLFGDSAGAGYVDRAPRNGIDDRRDAWLMGLSVRFAPWMVRNTIDFPMDWRKFVYQGASFPLFVDVFSTSDPRPRVIHTESINMQGIDSLPCPTTGIEAASDTLPDCRLLALLDSYGPEVRRAPRAHDPARSEARVLFFDFPGDGPETWAQEYEGPIRGTLSRRYLGWAKSFVHPFIAMLPGRPSTDPRYEVVLQYWLFYPYNDAGNIHEGDWEHINVSITTRAQGERGFTADEVQALLAQPPADDEFIIRYVDYYFHHWVFRLDYFAPNVYLPRDEWEKQADAMPEERVGERHIWEQIRRQAYMDEAETRLNLHPIIFMGGDNRGLQQLIAKPTRFQRASNGSYPFVGLYKDVGPAGTGELIERRWDLFRTPPDSNALESERIVRLDNPDRLELLPDWERVLPDVYADATMRAQWAWLVLPIRFGWPASVSPFAGIVPYAETGNLSIPGPTFNSGWNRAGTTSSYAAYEPHRMSSYFPASLQDNFRTGWGYFNLTVPLLVTLPPFDILFRVVSAPFKATSKSIGPAFSISQTVPFRVVGVSAGVASFQPGEAWGGLFLVNELFLPLVTRIEEITGSDEVTLSSSGMNNERAQQWLGGINLYLGRKVVSESSLRHSRSLLETGLIIDGAPGVRPLRGTLNFWEFVGSVRYNFAVESFQPYLKGGYGLSWYRLEDVTFDGDVLGEGESTWIRKPGLFENLLPNTWHLGAGLEYVPIRSVGGVDLGGKLDIAVHTHNLGTQRPGEFQFVQDSRVYRWMLSLALNVSY